MKLQTRFLLFQVSPHCSSHLTSHLTQLLLAIGSSPGHSPLATSVNGRELGAVLLDAVGPQCVTELKQWPEEETLKYSLERSGGHCYNSATDTLEAGRASYITECKKVASCRIGFAL